MKQDRIILYGKTADCTKEGTLYRAENMTPVEGRTRIQLVEVFDPVICPDTGVEHVFWSNDHFKTVDCLDCQLHKVL